MSLYPCLDCHRLSPSHRCPTCQKDRDRRRNARRLQYKGTWEVTSRKARKAQPWCTRCGATTDLTLDHESGTVECRSCNSRHRRDH
jgi:hypothetical protein